MPPEAWSAVLCILPAKFLRDAVIRACKAENWSPVEAQLQYLCPRKGSGERENRNHESTHNPRRHSFPDHRYS